MTQVREAAMTMPRIDTHSHYEITPPSLRDIARGMASFEHSAGLSMSKHLALGCRKMYGVDCGDFLRPDSPEEAFVAADELRSREPGEMLTAALDADNITTQFCFSGHFPEHSPHTKLTPRVKLLAYIDQAIAGYDQAFCPDGRDPEFCYHDALCAHFGELGTLDDYLGSIDTAIDGWRDHGVVGMKTALAYTLGLDFTDPSYDDAKSAFDQKRDMSPEQVTAVQHYAFRRSVEACQRNGLPVVVHTGFQIWGHSDLRQSNPMHLHKLMIDERYKDITWVLLHGGNPYTGETTYLARMFPNVVIDFTWVSWMTRARFRMALAEWIEIVPHGRFCWGSDSALPENIVGIGQVTREVIANVLEELIERRIIDEGIALEWLELTYQKNPARVFDV